MHSFVLSHLASAWFPDCLQMDCFSNSLDHSVPTFEFRNAEYAFVYGIIKNDYLLALVA